MSITLWKTLAALCEASLTRERFRTSRGLPPDSMASWAITLLTMSSLSSHSLPMGRSSKTSRKSEREKIS